MKPRSIGISLVLLVITASVASATPEHKKKISLAEPTVVASVWLQPGEYTLKWDRIGGDNVEVSFVQGARTIATVPGKVEAGPSDEDVALVLGETDGTGARPLVAIEMKGSRLIFPELGARNAVTGDPATNGRIAAKGVN